MELNDEPRGLRLVYLRIDPGRLEMDWFVAPGRVTVGRPHVHPTGGEEHWELLAGEAAYRVGDEEQRVSAPHSWPIPPDTPHVHPWNVGEDEMQVRQTIVSEEHPDVLEGVARFFETVFALSAQGKVKDDGDIRDPLQQALTIYELLIPGTWLAGPPRWAQRALFATVGFVARRTGRRAYVPAGSG
jgi:quercetin dioxygenase-like cupin family protein